MFDQEEIDIIKDRKERIEYNEYENKQNLNNMFKPFIDILWEYNRIKKHKLNKKFHIITEFFSDWISSTYIIKYYTKNILKIYSSFYNYEIKYYNPIYKEQILELYELLKQKVNNKLMERENKVNIEKINQDIIYFDKY